MSVGQEGLKEEEEAPAPRRFLRQILLVIINPREAFLRVKDSPSVLPMAVIPPILVILTFAQYYVFYRVKMDIPAAFYTEQIDSFVNSLIQFRLMQYIIIVLFGILLLLLIFSSGRFIGGYGNFKQGISVTGYVHLPNVLGLVIIILLILSTPAVPTGVLTLVGYPARGQYEDNIVIGLRDYVGEESNLTIRVRGYYGIPLNATISSSGAIIGATRIVEGEINITYAAVTLSGINKTVKRIWLNGTSINYNTPLIMKNVFDSGDYCTGDCVKRFTVDLTLFLNNTYVSPVQENMSIPYTVTLNVYDARMKMESYEVSSSFYTEVAQCPDPQPLVNIINEKISPIVQVLIIAISIWQFLLFAISLRFVHEFQWVKAILFVGAYAAAKFLLLGFTI
ncbi:MAG: YIP1 family protein [Candidatus Brockarchaeota archaeon]|nr:YIP1 family protein [Candidatus Brockarchaeota archaeon]